MTLPDWNVEDYLFEFEPIQYTGRLVDAPLIFKTGKVLGFLHDSIFSDAFKALKCGAELSALLMGFSIIEYLAGYYTGRRTKSEDFISFINAYFPDVYSEFIDDIYTQLRCGLVHNLNLQNPWKPSENKFKIETNSKYHLKKEISLCVLSIYHFLADSRRAMVMYLYDLVMKKSENQDLIKNFEKRFNRQEGVTSIMIKS